MNPPCSEDWLSRRIALERIGDSIPLAIEKGLIFLFLLPFRSFSARRYRLEETVPDSVGHFGQLVSGEKGFLDLRLRFLGDLPIPDNLNPGPMGGLENDLNFLLQRFHPQGLAGRHQQFPDERHPAAPFHVAEDVTDAVKM